MMLEATLFFDISTLIKMLTDHCTRNNYVLLSYEGVEDGIAVQVRPMTAEEIEAHGVVEEEIDLPATVRAAVEEVVSPLYDHIDRAIARAPRGTLEPLEANETSPPREVQEDVTRPPAASPPEGRTQAQEPATEKTAKTEPPVVEPDWMAAMRREHASRPDFLSNRKVNDDGTVVY